MTHKLLAGAAIVSNWTSLAGALHGVLRYLGIETNAVQVMGTSGHAFRLEIAEGAGGIASPESPLAIGYQEAAALYANLGFAWELIEMRPDDPDYSRRREQAIDRIRRSIDRGRPAAIYGLQVPEFGVVKGYDDRVRCFFASTPVSSQYGEAIPWSQWPAPGHPAWIEVLLPGERRRVDAAAGERAALAFAVRHARQAAPAAPAEAAHGFAAFTRWLEAYQEPERLDPYGNARCLQTLQAARRDAAAYLRAIAPRYRESARQLLEQAASAYDSEALSLSRVATLFP